MAEEGQKKFFNIPLSSSSSDITSEQLKLRDDEAKKKQANGPFWKRAARGIFDNSIDAAMSMLGFPINESKASQAGELVNAGLPFAAYGTKGIKSIYHGTQKAFDKFNPSVYDKGDVLGWLTHFAENPEYAGKYAMGEIKGLKNLSNELTYPLKEASDLYSYNGPSQKLNPRLLVAEPDAKNVLDLVDPNADDISQVLATMPEHERNFYLNQFKSAKKRLRLNPDDAQSYLLDERHYPESVPAGELPIRHIADKLKLTPDQFESSPFDAIRYRDINEKSWAIPDKTPIKSIYGPALNDAAEGKISPIRMVRDDSVSTGMFPVRNNKRLRESQEAKRIFDELAVNADDKNLFSDAHVIPDDWASQTADKLFQDFDKKDMSTKSLFKYPANQSKLTEQDVHDWISKYKTKNEAYHDLDKSIYNDVLSKDEGKVLGDAIMKFKFPNNY